jgi:hypothetical protein
MIVNLYNTMTYENTKPNKANCRKGKIDAKCVFTKDYEEKCG